MDILIKELDIKDYEFAFMYLNKKDSKWYQNINNFYKNILNHHGLKVVTKNYRSHQGHGIIPELLEDLCENHSDKQIYVFNPIDFACFCTCYPRLATVINNFLSKIKYIVIWQEILLDNFNVIGHGNTHKKFNLVHMFFNNSLLNISSNYISINSLEKHGIKQNKYFTVTGYSEINKIIPFEKTTDKDIDVLIYGSYHDTFTHRLSIISELQKLNNGKYNIHNYSDIFGERLDELLQKTKIVVHVPSHSNLTHMPWPKITYLQARKVFFIIEDNNDLHQLGLNNMIAYYDTSVIDLFNKIEYYLEHEELRQKMINDNYDYIFNNSNMDIVVPDLFNGLIFK